MNFWTLLLLGYFVLTALNVTSYYWKPCLKTWFWCLKFMKWNCGHSFQLYYLICRLKWAQYMQNTAVFVSHNIYLFHHWINGTEVKILVKLLPVQTPSNPFHNYIVLPFEPLNQANENENEMEMEIE